MADIYIDSRNSQPGRDGSAGNPFQNFSELAPAYTLAGGNNYKLRFGSYWNASACWLLPSLTTLPITITAYGDETEGLPVIECFRMATREECNTEVAITQVATVGTAAGATTDAAGYAIGATVINLAAAGAGTLIAGGFITFAGDANQYQMTVGDANVSNGGSITLAAPGLLQAIVGATAITRVTGTLTKPQAGTNLWRVPARFFGLFGDDVWGAQRDIGDSVGYGSDLPVAPRESSYQATDGGLYRLVYSIGNPFDAFGGLYLTNVSDADYAAGSYRQAIIGIFQGAGGVAIEGIEFGRGFNSVRYANGNGSAANPLFKEYRVKNCVFRNNLRGPYFNSTNNENLGYAKVRVTDNYFENIGNSCVWMSGGVMNDTLIERNVMNGWGYAYSTGCIYVGGGVHTTDGSRITSQFNSISGGVAGRVYITDGYSLYQEAGDFTAPMYRPTSDVEFRWNFLWNNDLSCISNKPGKNIVWRGNVAYCKPGVSPAHWGKFMNATFGTQYGGTVASDVTVIDNIGIGFLRFMFNGAGLAAKWTVKGNVCTSEGDKDGYVSVAISWTDADYTRMILDGNNFIGFTRMWYDGAVNRTAPPYVLNAITSDPAAELARLPVPTDPTVNYALMIGPGPAIQGGVVDLRFGSTLAS